MSMNIIQLIISIPLFTLLAFGIGFILNMMLRTTWLPVFLTLGVIVGSLLYMQIIPSLVDAVILTFGLVGSILSGWVIRYLRQKGYRMF